MTKKDKPRRGSFMSRWFHREGGLSEVAGAIFVIPVMGFLIFALVESGINMNTRAKVNSITQDTAMSIASDGALWWILTSPPRIDADNTWEDVGKSSLALLCDGGGGSCDEETVKMTCTITPTTANVPSSEGIQVAQSAGSAVKCLAEVDYDNVSPLSGNPITSMGLSGLFNSKIESTATAQTVVGYND